MTQQTLVPLNEPTNPPNYTDLKVVWVAGTHRPTPVTIRHGGGHTRGGGHGGRVTYEYGGVVYPSQRQLLVALTGHPEGRHWTFNRFFRQGQYSRGFGGWEVIDGKTPIMDVCGSSLSLLTVGSSTSQNLGSARCHRAKVAVGIDLDRRAGEVAKLLFAGFGAQIYANGYDPDDVLQEVYKGLWIRNQGKCPWDPAKSSFGHYVHMVAGCVVSNYHRKLNRQRAVEVTGVACVGDADGGWGTMDVAEACGSKVMVGGSSLQTHELMLHKDFVVWLQGQAVGSKARQKEREVALQILPLVLDHRDRGEIALAMGLSKAVVSRAMGWLRGQAGVWANGVG